jgi:hypothetical protein
MNANTQLFSSRLITLPLAGFLLCILAACNSSNDDSSASDSTENNLTVNSPTLATVNGEPITQADVDFMISRTFSSAEQLFSDEKMHAKVLDSLIASKAMRQSMLASLSAEQLAEIEMKANAYKEELFVKQYLTQNAIPEPVSTQMVSDYYTRYPEEFGGGESRLFEMITTNSKPDETKRNDIVSKANALKSNSEWSNFAQNNALSYRQANMQPGLLEPALERAVKSLKVGESSDLIFVKEIPYMVRVLNIEPLPAKPLSEVGVQIRKKLAALQLKKSVKAASQQAISNADVVRVPPKQGAPE